MNVKMIIETAQTAAAIMLENGGETYRAEETAARICASSEITAADLIALPTGIVISAEHHGQSYTSVKRIRRHTVDLGKLNDANVISRKLCEGKLSVAEAAARLKLIYNDRTRRRFAEALCAAIASAFFSMLMQGTLIECLISGVCGFLSQLISEAMSEVEIYRLVLCLVSGIVIASIAVAAGSFISISIEKVVVGATIPMLPGLSLTNAIRDTITGDLVSGITRAVEALLTAAAIASGVGIVFAIYINSGGTIL